MGDLFGSVPMLGIALATVVGLTLAFALDRAHRRRQLERLGHLPMLERMTGSLSNRRRVLRAVLFTLGATGVVLALAHPQGHGEIKWQRRGIDVALVLDYSKSMLAADVYPSRLERMNVAIDELLEDLETDRIATVVFAGAAIHFPLTHDHRAARLLSEEILPSDMPPGSDLGEAVRVARCLLRPDVVERGCGQVGGRGQGGAPLDQDGEQPALGDGALQRFDETGATEDRARAIVIFTDGEDTESDARPEIEEALRLGIEVYLVGVGTLAGELVPEVNDDGEAIGWKKHPDGSFVTTKLDQAGLKELASLAGGDDHYAVLDSSAGALTGLTGALRSLKAGNLDERAIKTFDERYQWVLFPAFVLLLIDACLSDRRRPRRAPRGGGESDGDDQDGGIERGGVA